MARRGYLLIYQIILFLRIYQNGIWPLCLPMCREDYNSLWFDFRSNFFSDLLELAVDWMVRLVHGHGLWNLDQSLPHSRTTSSFLRA